MTQLTATSLSNSKKPRVLLHSPKITLAFNVVLGKIVGHWGPEFESLDILKGYMKDLADYELTALTVILNSVDKDGIPVDDRGNKEMWEMYTQYLQESHNATIEFK